MSREIAGFLRQPRRNSGETERPVRRISAVALACIALPLAAEAQGQQALTGFEAFAQEPAMSSAAVSPDGRHIATLQRFAKDGKQFLLIYELGNMSKKPRYAGGRTEWRSCPPTGPTTTG